MIFAKVRGIKVFKDANKPRFVDIGRNPQLVCHNALERGSNRLIFSDATTWDKKGILGWLVLSAANENVPVFVSDDEVN